MFYYLLFVSGHEIQMTFMDYIKLSSVEIADDLIMDEF